MSRRAGIHVDGVSLVVHIDPPKDAKDYLHRAGRTARAGESGTVVTLVMPRQRQSTYSMLERAGVVPGRTEVRLGGPELEALTGAQKPSGIPVRFDRMDAPARRDRDHGPRDRDHQRGGLDHKRGGFGRDRARDVRRDGRPEWRDGAGQHTQVGGGDRRDFRGDRGRPVNRGN